VKIEVACFDMDGTLIRGDDSVRLLCALNGRREECERIEHREQSGELSWIEADHHKAALMAGLRVSAIEDRFMSKVSIIGNIVPALRHLRAREIAPILVTAGPAQVAELVGRTFEFAAFFGSQYEAENDRFTGNINEHVGDAGKLRCLHDYCSRQGFSLSNCVAVGNGESDIELFAACGRSIAINYAEVLKGKASAYFVTDDLVDILAIVDCWLAES